MEIRLDAMLCFNLDIENSDVGRITENVHTARESLAHVLDASLKGGSRAVVR